MLVKDNDNFKAGLIIFISDAVSKIAAHHYIDEVSSISPKFYLSLLC
jgi:hypothetical protein